VHIALQVATTDENVADRAFDMPQYPDFPLKMLACPLLHRGSTLSSVAGAAVMHGIKGS
jgi:hypothetical protein